MNFLYLTKDRQKSVKLITVLFLIAGLILSFRLWAGERLFPLVPFVDGLERIPYQFNYVPLLFLIFLLLYELYKPNKWSLALALIALFFLILQDQNRLQPWVYIYILILLPFCFSYFFKTTEKDLTRPMRIIFIFMYFWSGVQKVNSNFINEGFTRILAGLFKIQDPIIIRNLLPLGYIIPVIEIFVAICLLSKKFRHLGVSLAVFTHIFILIYVSPIGINYNYIVCPWNVAMIFLVIILFYKDDTDFIFWNAKPLKATFINYFYILLLGLLPILNFWGQWDDNLSFSLYSEKRRIFYIAISDKYMKQFDHKFDDYFLKLDDNVQGGKVIDVNKWSMKELNVPICPEIRVFEKITKDFCRYGIPSTDIIFLMYEGTVVDENLTKWTCEK